MGQKNFALISTKTYLCWWL